MGTSLFQDKHTYFKVYFINFHQSSNETFKLNAFNEEEKKATMFSMGIHTILVTSVQSTLATTEKPSLRYRNEKPCPYKNYSNFV